jgi:hypothetical protein
MKLLLRLIYSFSVLAVDHKDETLCASIVMSPEWANFILTANVPYIEFHILIRYGFHVKADCERMV